MNHKLVLDHVSLQYKETFAVNSISTTLEFGKIYGLIGRNGAGKTSLLSIIASYQKPSDGMITYDGEELFEHPSYTRNIHFGYDRSYGDEFHEKASQYVKAAKKYRPFFDETYAYMLVDKFKIDLNKPIKTYSKGMVAAFHVMLGLASRSPITIFDEIYLGMDAPTREKFYKELLEEQERNERTFILSTHLVSEMDHLFEHILMLDRGELIVDENYETFINKGITLTGDAQKVDQLTAGKTLLHTESVGGTKAATVYGDVTDNEWMAAKEAGIEASPASLQHLFTHLTKEDDDE